MSLSKYTHDELSKERRNFTIASRFQSMFDAQWFWRDFQQAGRNLERKKQWSEKLKFIR